MLYYIVTIFLKGGIIINIKLLNKDFNEEQIVEIKKAIKQNLDVLIMLNENFDANQLKQIRLGLAAGINVSLYALEIFSYEQMLQIREGLMAKIDASLYASLKYRHSQMQILKELLIRKYDISFMLANNFNENQMKVYYLMFLDGIDANILSEISSINYSDNCLKIIRRLILMGCDYKVFTKTMYNKNYLIEIMKLYCQNIDFSHLIQRDDLNNSELKILRSALEAKLDSKIIENFLNLDISSSELQNEITKTLNDVCINEYLLRESFQDKFDRFNINQKSELEKIANINIYKAIKLKDYDFKAEQLEEIRFGCEDGIDILPYVNENTNEMEMSIIRNKLLISKKINESSKNKSIKSDIRVYINKSEFTSEKDFNCDFYCDRISGIWKVIRLSDDFTIISARDVEKLIKRFISYINLTQDMEPELIKKFLNYDDFNNIEI